MRVEYEGLHKSEAITTSGARFYNNPAGFAMNRYAYYVCFKCKKVRSFVLCSVHIPRVEHRSSFKQSCFYMMAEEAFRKRTVGFDWTAPLRMSLFTMNRMEKHGWQKRLNAAHSCRAGAICQHEMRFRMTCCHDKAISPAVVLTVWPLTHPGLFWGRSSLWCRSRTRWRLWSPWAHLWCVLRCIQSTGQWDNSVWGNKKQGTFHFCLRFCF